MNEFTDIDYFYKKSIKNKLTKKDASLLWELQNYSKKELPPYTLLYLANCVKKHNNSNNIDLCSIINAKSGLCSENCAFCSQSLHNSSKIKEYPLKPKEDILKQAKYIEKYSNRFSIVVSGKTVNDKEYNEIIDIIKDIKKETNLKVCVSLGLLDNSQLKELKDLEVRIHNNLETSKEYFDKICTTHTYYDKVKTIKTAKKIGLEVCSGGIIGIGETLEDRINLFYELKELGVDGIPINIYNPIKGTKTYELLNNNLIKQITPIEALNSIALCKLILPDKEVRLCGGREYNLRDWQSLSLLAIDGLMIGNYLTTNGRNIEDDIKMIADGGFDGK